VTSAHPEHSGPPRAAGDFLRVQRDVALGRSLIKDDGSALITVTGPDRLTWLNSLITQDVLGLTPGHTAESLLLNPQGRVEHAFFLTDDGVTTWLLVPAGGVDALESWLRSMVFRMDVTIERPQDVVVVMTTSEALLENVSSLAVFSDPWPRVGVGSVGYAADVHPGHDWEIHSAVVSREDFATLAIPAVTPEHVDALSIAAARPTMRDVDEKTLPHELDWLRTAVHLNKGCYRGQEAVAKVHNLGHPPRRITLLHLDGSESLLPSAGDDVMLGEKSVGRITRAAWHYELGPIALAMLKRTTPVEEALTVITGGRFVGAHQEVIVPIDAGATRDIPKLGRLR
jgi:tRNA-modifying protein YgfZ